MNPTSNNERKYGYTNPKTEIEIGQTRIENSDDTHCSASF
jgi:hypothetical protein